MHFCTSKNCIAIPRALAYFWEMLPGWLEASEEGLKWKYSLRTVNTAKAMTRMPNMNKKTHHLVSHLDLFFIKKIKIYAFQYGTRYLWCNTGSHFRVRLYLGLHCSLIVTFFCDLIQTGTSGTVFEFPAAGCSLPSMFFCVEKKAGRFLQNRRPILFGSFSSTIRIRIRIRWWHRNLQVQLEIAPLQGIGRHQYTYTQGSASPSQNLVATWKHALPTQTANLWCGQSNGRRLPWFPDFSFNRETTPRTGNWRRSWLFSTMPDSDRGDGCKGSIANIMVLPWICLRQAPCFCLTFQHDAKARFWLDLRKSGSEEHVIPVYITSRRRGSYIFVAVCFRVFHKRDWLTIVGHLILLLLQVNYIQQAEVLYHTWEARARLDFLILSQTFSSTNSR